MKLSCIIVDDEPLALNLLEKYISRTDFLHLEARCKNAIQAKAVLDKMKIDVVFLDIHMPDINGIELSKTINKDTRIIFTTAFTQYAVQGYKVNALDYLVKPFNYEEFSEAAVKAKEWFDFFHAQDEPEKEFIFVRSEYRQVKIMLDEVLYFEGLKDYVKIWIKDNPRPILSLLSLKTLEEKLPSSKFMRIHRSFIISFDKIKQIKKNEIHTGDIHIPIARQYKDAFRANLSDKTLPL